MPENIKKAHIKRAMEQYNDEGKDTPGDFSEFFQNQYVKEYEEESKTAKPKKDQNAAVIDRYESYLASSRKNVDQETPGLLSRVQTEDKGPYPANPEEDEHLVAQIMKFLHSEEIQDSIAKMLKTSKGNITESIAQIAANMALKLVYEIRKQRDVTDDGESAILTIIVEDLWTIARRMGMKRVPQEAVRNSVRVAGSIYNQMEEQMKTSRTEQVKPVEQLAPQQPGQPQQVEQPPAEG